MKSSNKFRLYISFSRRRRLAKRVTAWQLKNGVAQNTLSTLASLQAMGWLQRPTKRKS